MAVFLKCKHCGFTHKYYYDVKEKDIEKNCRDCGKPMEVKDTDE